MNEPVQPKLTAAIERFESLGVFQAEALGCGERGAGEVLDLTPGRWCAWLLEEEVLDDLVDEEEVDEDAPQQLLLVRELATVPSDRALPPLVFRGQLPIEGASFTVACSSVVDALQTDDGFYEYLDGVHGLLQNGRGVHVMLSGDGAGEVWCQPDGDLVLVNLQ